MSEEAHSLLQAVIGDSTETLVAEAVWACDYHDEPATWSNVEKWLMTLHQHNLTFTPDQADRYIGEAINSGEVSANPTDAESPLGEWTFAIQPELANRIARRYWCWQLEKETHFLTADSLPGEAVVVRAAVLAYQNEHDVPPLWPDLIERLATFGYEPVRAHELICDAKQYGLITNVMWMEGNEDTCKLLAELQERWRYICTGPL